MNGGIDAAVDAFVRPLADALAAVVFFDVEIGGVSLPLVVLWLAFGATWFTVRFRFINVRGFFHAISLLRQPRREGPGEVSHFQALATAISGTVGIGNIGGVAVAVTVGGPGAAFWMIVAGVLGMSTKFVECTLGVIYRRENPDGSVSGGPMFYLERGLAERGWARLGRGLGLFYATGIVIGCLGIGNMFQSNQAFTQLVGVTGGEASFFADKGWLVGMALASVVAAVILGGIRSIARVAATLVPFMAALYLVGAALVLYLNAEALPDALAMMWAGAFQGEAAAGGALGALVVGFQRAVFSNEAGIGSATIAHAAVRTDEPLTEGYVSLLEPFIDTVVICSATALVVITTMALDPGFATGLGGIEITSAAFERRLSWAPVPLALAATLFAFSTMVSWSYYGLKGFSYLVGEGPRARHLFNGVFCVFVALGCMVKLEAILDFSDALVFLICVPNLLGLYLLAPVVQARLAAYRT
ncbi:MAG: alanine/glycine:cation symporter family protein [Myxococcota bacterium]|nr:alanine/glycine:cation symporter family protein [Myxococcota bacterium]